MHRILLLIIYVLLVTQMNSQSLQAVRLEVNSDIDAEQFHVSTMGERGMMIFYESRELNRETSKRKWYFGLFDSGLKQKWLKYVDLSDKIEYIDGILKGNTFYFLFKNINSEKSDYGFYEILKYNVFTEKFYVISGSVPLKADVAGFDIIGQTACIALNLKKNACDLVFVNLESGDVNPVNVNKNVPGLIQSVYASVNTFVIAVKQSRDNRYIQQYFQSYSVDGKMRWEMKTEDNDALNYFRDFSFYNNDRNELLVFGTYGIVTGRNLSFKDIDDENGDDQSEGVYFLKIDKGKQKALKYYDFFKFKSISGAFKPSDLKKRKVSDTTNRKNREVMSASFNVTDPLLEKIDTDKFLFSVEAFRPYYKTETRMDYDFYGRAYPYTYNVFSGYDFFDVVVVAFDDSGNMLWNNDFSIEDILTYSRKRNSIVFASDNYVTMAYVNNGAIFSQIVDANHDIDRSKTIISTDYPRDFIIEDNFNRIVPWYGDYYLIYGYQKIRNRSLDNKPTRNVFYINKIAYK